MSDDINDVRHTSTLAKFEEAVRSSDVAATPREAFIRELRSAPSLDDNGYICTKDVAIRAFDRSCGGVAQPSAETRQLIHQIKFCADFAEPSPDEFTRLNTAAREMLHKAAIALSSTQNSPPDLPASQLRTERDPSVMPDRAGGETLSRPGRGTPNV